jgi:ubiquitin-like protein Pup
LGAARTASAAHDSPESKTQVRRDRLLGRSGPRKLETRNGRQAKRQKVERRTQHDHSRTIHETNVETTEQEPTLSALKKEMDEILDEIDEALEENAEEFVTGYVQKGGGQ